MHKGTQWGFHQIVHPAQPAVRIWKYSHDDNCKRVRNFLWFKQYSKGSPLTSNNPEANIIVIIPIYNKNTEVVGGYLHPLERELH